MIKLEPVTMIDGSSRLLLFSRVFVFNYYYCIYTICVYIFYLSSQAVINFFSIVGQGERCARIMMHCYYIRVFVRIFFFTHAHIHV